MSVAVGYLSTKEGHAALHAAIAEAARRRTTLDILWPAVVLLPRWLRGVPRGPPSLKGTQPLRSLPLLPASLRLPLNVPPTVLWGRMQCVWPGAQHTGVTRFPVVTYCFRFASVSSAIAARVSCVPLPTRGRSTTLSRVSKV